MAARNRSRDAAIGTRATTARAASNYIEFVTRTDKCPAIRFEGLPGSLIVIRALRHHVRHQERRGVVCN